MFFASENIDYLYHITNYFPRPVEKFAGVFFAFFVSFFIFAT